VAETDHGSSRREAGAPPPPGAVTSVTAEVVDLDASPGPVGRGTADDPRLVIESWMAVPVEGAWLALLLRRAPDHGGFWQGVSGRVEPSDRSLRHAALREITEETGLSSGIAILDLGRWISFRGLLSGTYFRKRSLGAVLPAGTRAEAVRLSEEHDAVELVTFDEARLRMRFPENAAEMTALERRLATLP